MTDVIVDEQQKLIELYAVRIRRDCRIGGEVGYAHAFVEALSDGEARHSNAKRLQRVNAVVAAAELVRAERQHLSPIAAVRRTVTVNPQVSGDSDSDRGTPTNGRGGAQ